MGGDIYSPTDSPLNECECGGGGEDACKFNFIVNGHFGKHVAGRREGERGPERERGRERERERERESAKPPFHPNRNPYLFRSICHAAKMSGQTWREREEGREGWHGLALIAIS